MDCLKCSNYWKTDVDELMCEFCPYLEEELGQEGEVTTDGEKASGMC